MASFAIHSSGDAGFIGKSQVWKDRHQMTFSTSNLAVKPRRQPVKVSASSMALAPPATSLHSSSSSSCGYNLFPFDKNSNEEFDNDIDSSSRVSEKLEEWMRDSVGDIVKNLKQAPLLVQIYANNGTGSTEIKTERAVAENWPNVIRKKQSLDGIILVEELGAGGEKELDMGNEIEEAEDGTKAWGVLIQGKGGERECGSACYLLKTSRVRAGLGLFCTHFCLVKVKSFRESALQQFTDSWLLH